jgi:hypothetical protein
LPDARCFSTFPSSQAIPDKIVMLWDSCIVFPLFSQRMQSRPDSNARFESTPHQKPIEKKTRQAFA